MTETRTLFVDTNAFIQLRDLGDLPWRELFPGVKQVAIMVARPVVEELDRFKVSTKSRLRDRSRLALSLIDRAAGSDGQTLVLRTGDCRVTLTVAPRKRAPWDRYPDLDEGSSDDRLVVAANEFGQGAEILSHDVGPRLSAKDIGLQAHAPPESWLLPPQRSDDQRKVAQLERQLQTALDRHPKVEIAFPDALDGVFHHIQPTLDPLDDAIRNQLVGRLTKENPPANLRLSRVQSIAMGNSLNGISEYEIESYAARYEDYRRRVEEYFAKLHTRVAAVAGLPRIAFEVSNVGQVSIVNLVIGIASSDFGLLAGTRDIESATGSMEPPEPPERPLGSHERLMRSISAHPMLSAAPRPRNPVEMNWHDRPPFGGHRGSYGCGDFRPGRTYPDSTGLHPDSADQSEGVFRVTASGNDMAQRSAEVTIRLERRHVGWSDPVLSAYLPQALSEALRQGE